MSLLYLKVLDEMGMYTLLFLKWKLTKPYCTAHRKSAQCYVVAWVRGEFGGECMAEYLHCSPETVTVLLVIWVYPNTM